MDIVPRLFFFAACLLVTNINTADADQAAVPRVVTREAILAAGQATAKAQIDALAGRAPTDWIGGVMWTGMMDLYKTDPVQEDTILQALLAAGQQTKWCPQLNPKEPFHADDYCFGQAILDAYETRKEAVDLQPLRLRCQSLAPYLLATADRPKLLTWSWCDALFMAPVVLVRYGNLAGDRQALDAANAEWWKVSAALYDPEEHLFYRDERFLPSKQRTSHGKKVFWSRGNGWVTAGLARMLTYLPKDYPDREKYVAQFREMTKKLASLQRADGTWPSSLLDPEETPASEFSGTAFYCTALAWGINEGILDRAEFLPVAAKAWAALLAMRRPDGLPGYVQAVSDSPGKVPRDATQLYATGGFCMAAAQLAKLAPFDLPEVAAPTESAAPDR